MERYTIPQLIPKLIYRYNRITEAEYPMLSKISRQRKSVALEGPLFYRVKEDSSGILSVTKIEKFETETSMALQEEFDRIRSLIGEEIILNNSYVNYCDGTLGDYTTQKAEDYTKTTEEIIDFFIEEGDNLLYLTAVYKFAFALSYDKDKYQPQIVNALQRIINSSHSTYEFSTMEFAYILGYLTYHGLDEDFITDMIEQKISAGATYQLGALYTSSVAHMIAMEAIGNYSLFNHFIKFFENHFKLLNASTISQLAINTIEAAIVLYSREQLSEEFTLTENWHWGHDLGFVHLVFDNVYETQNPKEFLKNNGYNSWLSFFDSIYKNESMFISL